MMILLHRALYDLHDRRRLTYLRYCSKSSLLSPPAFTVASLPTLIERNEPLGAVKGILSIASDNIHTKATKTLIEVFTSSSYRSDTRHGNKKFFSLLQKFENLLQPLKTSHFYAQPSKNPNRLVNWYI